MFFNRAIMKKQQGFTFIEVLVASAIGAGIAFMAYQALTGALNIEARVSKVTELTNTINRTWQFLADDVQHAVARPWSDTFNNTQPAMTGAFGDRVSQSADTALSGDSHLLLFVRSGEKNFFQQPRSNLQMVGYRITEEESEEPQAVTDEENQPGNLTLWRDYWRPVDAAGEAKVKSRRLLDHIKSIRFRYLPSNIERVTDDAWVNGWPESTAQNAQLPVAIEVTMEVTGFGEIQRLFLVVQTPSVQ